MCFHVKQSFDVKKLEERYQAVFEKFIEYKPHSRVNAFEHPRIPIITNINPQKIELFYWGLLPEWTEDINFRKYTLNAQFETINEKPSFKKYVFQRCLIPVEGFFEWQWLDDKGKHKKQFYIYLKNYEIFSIAGLWNRWLNRTTGEIIPTFTLLTIEANDFMSKIHNSKKRMPLILSIEQEKQWLNGNNIIFEKNLNLEAIEVL